MLGMGSESTIVHEKSQFLAEAVQTVAMGLLWNRQEKLQGCELSYGHPEQKTSRRGEM
jgi:hypothetical protein